MVRQNCLINDGFELNYFHFLCLCILDKGLLTHPTIWILCFLQDIFAVAVSLITGRIVYISDQAASILNCKRDVFKNSKFVEFLTPQDVSVFYSFTTPYRLPSWSMFTGAGRKTTQLSRQYHKFN